MRFVQMFVDYSENALKQVIEQAPGKPFKNEFNITIGTIESARIYDEHNVALNGLNAIEFNVKLLNESEYKGLFHFEDYKSMSIEVTKDE